MGRSCEDHGVELDTQDQPVMVKVRSSVGEDNHIITSKM